MYAQPYVPILIGHDSAGPKASVSHSENGTLVTKGGPSTESEMTNCPAGFTLPGDFEKLARSSSSEVLPGPILELD